MKTINLSRVLTVVAALAVLGWAAGGVVRADDMVVTHHDAWSHDKDGYWDGHGSHHAFVMHDNHHGYWREKPDGTRIFIKID
jgi:hypothetical protein